MLKVRELIELRNQRKFHPTRLISHSTCSFEITYISSYLFVRGVIEKIEEKYGVDKLYKGMLVFDIASFLDLPKEMLLYAKDLQLNILSELNER